MKEKLGWGAFSTVWRCSDQKEGQDVAVKVTKSDKETTEQVTDEIELLKAVGKVETEHTGKENVMRLLGSFSVAGENGSHLCLAMELLGANLLKCLDNRMGMCLSNVKVVMHQVLQGLDFLHTQAGIIHTDIKPENILLVDPGIRDLSLPVEGLKVKIADLGSGCWVERHFSLSIGTTEYRGPELLLGLEGTEEQQLGGYGPPVDVWAAACLAFELSTGEDDCLMMDVIKACRIVIVFKLYISPLFRRVPL